MKSILALSWLLFFSVFQAGAALMKVDAEKGKTEFQARGVPSSLRIDGQGAGPSGELTTTKVDGKINVAGEFSVSMKSLDSGIELRDKHMKNKYLEVEKFETATLSVDQLMLPASLQEGITLTVPFEGRLKFHGVEKPIKGEIELKKTAGAVVQFVSGFSIKISDYGVDIPKFAGITVTDEVKIKVTSEVIWSEKL